jgi:hypothetical protein
MVYPLHRLLILFFTLFFIIHSKPHLHGNLEQDKVIKDLQQRVIDCGLFHGCMFEVFNPNLLVHKNYFKQLEAWDFIT